VSDSAEPPVEFSADLGPAVDLYPGMRRVVQIGQTSVLVHVESDGIFAIENSCPHYQVELNLGVRRLGYVECPWHHWLINVRTGECLHNPRQQARTLPVTIVAGRAIVAGDPTRDTPHEKPAHLR
jgi:nitrite reductase/ring-hydroxylating ferredoxin subunit